ncbi:MAG: SseB family protein [Silicimonas sp.]|nr:SseB family protein [Silicimonas sp.]
MTPLDIAHAAMTDQDTDAARLAFYDRFATAELFVLLEAEPEGDNIKPQLFQTEQGAFVLAFDTEARLTDFNQGPAPYAAITGRTLAQMLASQPIGVGLNLWENPSAFLLPAGTLAWLNDVLAEAPQAIEDTPEAFSAPKGLPEVLITAIDARLASAEGLAKFAYLAGVTYKGGRPGHVLAFVDAKAGVEDALAGTIREALVFSGLEAGVLDVTFLKASDPLTAHLARVGLRFDLPQPASPTQPSAPGMDPSKPPKLR